MRLSKCEEQVMSIIWSTEEELDLMQTLERVNEKYGHEWKSQTVSTFLVRLAKKNYLIPRKQGRYTYYRPSVNMEDYKRAAVQELEFMFGELVFENDIKELHENEEGKRHGKIYQLELPCKIGDTVYIIGSKYRHGTIENWVNKGKFRISDMEKLNETVFLTEEAAWQKLKERNRTK